MNLERYLFIDAGHLRRYFVDSLHAWSGVTPELVIDQVKTTFDAGKCFYYDAIDDERRPNEDEVAFHAHLAAEEAWFDKVQRTDATHVRLGSVTGTQKN